MFLHLGQDTVIIEDDIIGIFDLDTTTVSKPTRDYLKTMQKSGNVVNVSYDLPKSFIITCKKKSKKKTMFISPISTATLLKRSENVNYLKDIK
nr:extracellular matrix/biofilm biosynthesis regulator RemA family protein [Ruminococcus sp.]